ncbi:energy-coupling factor transporter transmembrane component T family protein [Paenibacillus lemnae]|uniref:Energy-coupling factor transporter transmembrane protein EcfT n=1 Tax=Paenibacillus lemnae TaxID=1330551 RepID=A0A848M810_PAELE|nr:energy-coupling factor transporter transmembrane component T [Paenibacillus lemnae]NMO95674.1 energy-coupling factor transporter transmembrane protein EcfT [Paenibacillus lemnae]
MSIWGMDRRTWLHRANPVIKLAVLLLLFTMTVLTHDIDFVIYQAVIFTICLVLLCGLKMWKILLFALPFLIAFVSSSSTMMLFGRGETIWWEWGLLRVSEESFYRGLHLGFKGIAFAAEGLLFVTTTSSVDLFYGLMQKLKLAPKFAYSFMASIRLLPMVWEEFLIRRQALQVRGCPPLRGVRGMIKRVGMYAVPLLAQSIRRAHRVAAAMEAEQFNGEHGRGRTYYYESRYSVYDLLIVILLTLAAAAAYMCASWYPWFGIGDVRFD